jgi:prepilin-type processing-associated H-X9-DG protein
LLIPTLDRARSEARRISCLNNLDQHFQVLLQYAVDHNEVYPVELTEHNPHLSLIQGLSEYVSAGAVKIFYCPEAESMEMYAQDADHYIPVGQTDSVIDTEANRAIGNISYIYWSFLYNKPIGWVNADECWREPAKFLPRVLTSRGGLAVVGGVPVQATPQGLPGEMWLMSDFFRRGGAPFPHMRGHRDGLNVLYLDGHVDLMFGQPQSNFR